jgi:hypothetical protein
MVQQKLLVADWLAEILESDEGWEMYDFGGQLIARGLSVRTGGPSGLRARSRHETHGLLWSHCESVCPCEWGGSQRGGQAGGIASTWIPTNKWDIPQYEAPHRPRHWPNERKLMNRWWQERAGLGRWVDGPLTWIQTNKQDIPQYKPSHNPRHRPNVS